MVVIYKLFFYKKSKGVGKSSILLRFITHDFKENHDPTFGAAFMSKLFNYNNNPLKY